MEESQVAEKVEKVLAENMKKELAQVVGKIQKLGVDPFGFGEIYRFQTRGGRALSHKDLHRLFQEAEMRYQVDVKIIRNGVMD
ncbi:Ger(x)C family spore germination C-terminal domain-containing protein [Brevibacillus composti]|uniref:Ger(x)C family spore germination C-terminal domain-containing protein n=1 Tax=Brevibacillus composti TaxID=2796470 RepID=UPI001E2B96BA|nr:Ger(x)C family spore germination C-terminal domain-containing protein [Brevibacillus composti]